MERFDLDRREHALVLLLGQRVDEQVAEAAELAVDALDRFVERAAGLGRDQVVDVGGLEPAALGQLSAGRLAAAALELLVVRVA